MLHFELLITCVIPFLLLSRYHDIVGLLLLMLLLLDIILLLLDIMLLIVGYNVVVYIIWGLLVVDSVVCCEREESRRTGRSIIAIHKSCVDVESTVAVPSIIATDALVEVRS